MALQMKLADDGFFVFLVLGMALGKVIYGAKFNLKTGWAEGQTGELGRHLRSLVHSLQTCKHTFINSGRKTLDQYKGFRF